MKFMLGLIVGAVAAYATIRRAEIHNVIRKRLEGLLDKEV